ncbi:MAG TPA: erythromycin esterase family protein [Flavobacteriales bacterium]|nr:erythromycin esterase family protein [Flavobacteriales bacterium]
MRWFLLLFFLPVYGPSQSIKAYVKENTAAIKSIDPQNEDYTDLEFFGKAVGHAQIVMLGEQTHGDASTFEAKTRLIKYLHEVKGFNVLAFEGDFFALNHGWDSIPKTKTVADTFLRNNIYSMWTKCHAAQHLFYEYLPSTFNTATPLIVTGFDNQLTMPWSEKHLVPYLDSLCRALCIPYADHPAYPAALDCIGVLVNMTIHTDSTVYASARHHLATIRTQLLDTLDKNDFNVYVVNSLLAFAKQMQYNDNQKAYYVSNNTRDRQMAANLKWLHDVKFKNEKIIVWAAAYHTSKHQEKYFTRMADSIMTMGGYLARDSTFIKKVYSMGFTSAQGKTGIVTLSRKKIIASKKEAFENWIDKSLSYAFVDFKLFNASHILTVIPYYMKYMGYLNYKGIWNYIFDGIFFIREMQPCEKAD